MNAQPKRRKFRLFSSTSSLFFPTTTVGVTEQEHEELLKDRQAGITSLHSMLCGTSLWGRMISSTVVSRK